MGVLRKKICGVLLAVAMAAPITLPAKAFPVVPDAESSRTFSQKAPEFGLIVAAAGDIESMGTGAQIFIQQMAGQAIDFLGDENMSMDRKKTAFKKLLSNSFDMKTIGRFTLGRYWRTATPEQRRTYQDLFEKMVLEVYSARFSDYKGQKFETRSFRTDGDKDTLVTSFIVPGTGPDIQVDWRVRYKNGSYKIVDVIVEGVSMSVTQRSDFSAVIQRGGGNVDVLIDHLRTP